MNKLSEIVAKFATKAPAVAIEPLGNGLINTTYLVKTESDDTPDYVLQKINTNVFRDPDLLQANIEAVCRQIRKKLEERGVDDIDRKVLEFIALADGSGKTFYRDSEGECWRVSVLIPNSSTPSEVTEDSARETGRAFADFQMMLTDIPETLGETIPDFHNMELRLAQMREAVEKNPAGRLDEVRDMVDPLLEAGERMTLLEKMYREGKLPKRICHCDTKVSNMLVDSDSKQFLCVIDLDTTMPSFISSDFGDFLRTAAATVAEDDPAVEKVDFRLDVFRPFAEGYLSVAKNFLTPAEISILPFAAELFPYMQCVRFLTDYINGDTYYAIKYPTHNLDRSRNQFALWKAVSAKQPEMTAIINDLKA